MRCEAHPGVIWVLSRHHAKARARALCVFPVILGALGVFGCGGDRPGGPPRQGSSKDTAAAVTFPLNEENHSGRHGEATLQPGEKIRPGPGGASGEGMRVSIRITPDTGESNPAHIHNVTCAQYRAMSSFSARLATVKDGLNALDHGRSETVVTVELPARTNGRYSINVHKPAHPYDVIACGDIPRH
jgi:hypothetical protein